MRLTRSLRVWLATAFTPQTALFHVVPHASSCRQPVCAAGLLATWRPEQSGRHRYGHLYAPSGRREPDGFRGRRLRADGAEDVDAVTLEAGPAVVVQPLSGTVFADRLHLVEQ